MMLPSFLILSFLINISYSHPSIQQSANTNCPNGYVFDSMFGKCYLYVSVPDTYISAEQTCKQNGAHLTSVTNIYENGLINENEAAVTNLTDFWFGANDLTVQSQWSWADGSAWGYTNWAAGQPTDAERCGSIMINGGKWRANDCSLKKGFVCSLAAFPPCPPIPGHCPSEWTYLQQTDSCYKTFYNMKFDDAENLCLQANAHLASIHSQVENTFIAELSKTGMKLEAVADFTIIGLHLVNKAFVWTDGTYPDYTNWQAKKPADETKDQCVQIYGDTSKVAAAYEGWNNFACSVVMRAFVCKKPASH